MYKLLHIYCGDGKGKTTASVGAVIRAIGNEMKVLFVQFLKNTPTGEIEILKNFDNVTILRGKDGDGFTFWMTEEQKENTKKIHNKNLCMAFEYIKEYKFDMVVFDEIIDAYNYNLIDKKMIDEFLINIPRNIEIIMTGRNPSKEMIKYADYVTEMKKIKHPYNKGIVARKGIEF